MQARNLWIHTLFPLPKLIKETNLQKKPLTNLFNQLSDYFFSILPLHLPIFVIQF